ncbi:phospho-sugar mutase [Helicobacter valdiviensis]|uniref:Phospho-sugar mutase n=1 Tax=Helicobacter valdiviensis TaxID=1458358 RepID=A0A2W6MVA4_9HELI|nr:phosphomannomutase/phosphoglucomutase [Helicobacter valdiviensis]PZT48464.1 phospho-sugar mutase [Helicobacter valdiviensis]
MEKLSIFREYDIRGVYPKELNFENVVKIGYLIGLELKRRGGKTIAVGYDARLHSCEIFSYLIQGLASAGVLVYTLGEIPTPVAYFALYQEFDGIRLDGSVMITGSHNPKEYNGFKITLLKEPFYGKDIYKLEEEFYKLDLPQTKEVKPEFLPALEKYIEFMVKEFGSLEGLDVPICIDCGNGVASLGVAEIFKRLKINYKGLFMEPDGNFPNHHPDPSEEKNLSFIKEELQKSGGIGFAFDGDGDRLAVLKKDKIYKGDELAIIFANSIENPYVIGEVKCSLNMYEAISKIGKTLMYKTGHSNLKVMLKEQNADMAFEVSGHIFFKHRYFGYDDATYALLRLLELVKKDGMAFDKVLEDLPKLYSTDEKKIESTDEKKFILIDRLKEALKNPPKDFPKIVEIVEIDGVRVIFKEGWGLIRASNTTPVLVTRFEAKSKEKMDFYEEKLLELLENVG